MKQIKVGDFCKCDRGIVGCVERITTRKGKPLYLGKTTDGKPWQSTEPTFVKRRTPESRQFNRKLHIDGEVWTWDYYRRDVRIASPFCEYHSVRPAFLLGLDEPEYYDYAYDEGWMRPSYVIKPSDVQKYIVENYT